MTRYMFGFLLVSLLVSGSTALAGDNDDSNGENRCDDLGTGCVCAESFNFDAVISGGGPTGRYFNPPNSTSKACHNEIWVDSPYYMGPDWATNPSVMVRAASVRPFPSGANPWILRGPISGIQEMTFLGGSLGSFLDITNSTVCDRAYVRLSDNVTLPTTNHRFKSLILSGTGSGTVEGHFNFEWGFGSDSGGIYLIWVSANYNGPDSTFGLIANATTICGPTTWCRLEVCLDQTASTLKQRMYLTRLDTGVTTTFSYPSTPASGPATASLGPERLPTMNMFAQDSFDADDFEYISHVMMAKVAYDPTFTIGAANELEGGAAPAIPTFSGVRVGQLWYDFFRYPKQWRPALWSHSKLH